jgi:hypothetical protein
VCREFVESLWKDGPGEVQRYLPELLADASQRGSGDDTTVGLLFRVDSNQDLWPDWRADQKQSSTAEDAGTASRSDDSDATRLFEPNPSIGDLDRSNGEQPEP